MDSVPKTPARRLRRAASPPLRGGRLRLLVLAATYPPTRCGVGDYVRRLVEELAARDAEVFVLTGGAVAESHDHGDGAAPGEVTPPPRSSRAVRPRFTAAAPGLYVSRQISHWDWRALPLVRGALREVEPHVLSLQFHGEDYLLHPAVCSVAALAARAGVPTVTTWHNLQAPRGWEGGPDPLEQLLADSAAWIATNAMDLGRLLERPRATDRLQMVTAGPCITAAQPRPARATKGALEVAYFGFLNPSKGIEYLLRAVAALRDEGLVVQLTLAAGLHTDPPPRLRRYAAFIEAELDRLGLDAGCRRHGFLSETEVTRLLMQADLAVFPFRDGLSGKNSSFWSTLHHGTPALTTRGPGLPEGLVHGKNVLLAPIDDAAALAREIRWAAEHRRQLEDLGRAGRDLVQRRFDWSDLAEQTLQVLRRAQERFDANVKQEAQP